MKFTLPARFIGSAFLVATVGSAVMGERLAGGKVAIALLANTIATGAALVTLTAPASPFQEHTSIPLLVTLMR